MLTWLFLPAVVQGGLILIDEIGFHYRRDLPRWERIGHPLDTISVILPLIICLWYPWESRDWFIGLSIFSCLFVTKDEWVHAKECSGSEQWLHAMLYFLHPLVFICAGWIWWKHPDLLWFVAIQIIGLVMYAIYQTVYWNFFRDRKASVNNDFYHELGDRWYKAQDDPVALLRAENTLFVSWIDTELRKRLDPTKAKLLDVACGGGLLSNALAKRGWIVTGIDLSKESLVTARRFDETRTVTYLRMDAENLNFEDQAFDVVFAMDMLEHVEHPEKVVSEASRVLRPGGEMFFHTFNRNLLSWLFVIKGVEWFVKNVPNHLHIYRLFVKPQELKNYCEDAGLAISDMRGVSPKFSWRTWRPLLLQRQVHPDFSFHFTDHTRIGYAGVATKPLT